MTCVLCEKIMGSVNATAEVLKDSSGYKLKEMPQMDSHICLPTIATNKAELAIRAMKKEVSKDPLRSSRDIYECIRKNTRSELSEKEKVAFSA